MRPAFGSTAMLRGALVWTGLAAVIGFALVAAATSPLLAWRDPIYIVAAFTGVVAFAFLLVQALLISRLLPGSGGPRARRVHRWIGAAIVGCVVIHVAGLYITSPPDVIDALLFASPTLFSVWGVVAMWAVFVSAVLAIFRRRLRLRTWRAAHVVISLIVVSATITHAIPIEGTMEQISKLALCGLTAIATLAAVVRRRSGLETIDN